MHLLRSPGICLARKRTDIANVGVRKQVKIWSLDFSLNIAERDVAHNNLQFKR